MNFHNPSPLVALGRKLHTGKKNPLPATTAQRLQAIDAALNEIAARPELSSDDKARGIKALKKARARVLKL